MLLLIYFVYLYFIGRSKSGQRCTTVAAGSRGANIHIIGGISSLGWMTYDVKRGSIKKPDAIEWMKFCLSAAMLKHGGPVDLIIDNAPCHSRVEQSILVDEQYKDCVLLRLSPYSYSPMNMFGLT